MGVADFYEKMHVKDYLDERPIYRPIFEQKPLAEESKVLLANINKKTLP